MKRTSEYLCIRSSSFHFSVGFLISNCILNPYNCFLPLTICEKEGLINKMAFRINALVRLAILTIGALLPNVASAAYWNHFISPPPMAYSSSSNYTANYVYTEGDIMTMQWQTNWTKISAVLWQNNNASSQYLPGGYSVPTTQSFSWLVDVAGLYDLSKGNVFFFSVFDEGSQQQFESHYFNITAGAASNASLASASSVYYATTTASAIISSATRNATTTKSTGLYTPPVPTAFATSQISSTAATAATSASTTPSASHTKSSGAVGKASGASLALVLAVLAAVGFGV